MNKARYMTNAEIVSLALLVVVLLILPLWGATAMLAGSIIGLAAFIFMFRERLRGRGWLTVVTTVVASAALAAAGAIAVSLFQPR